MPGEFSLFTRTDREMLIQIARVPGITEGATAAEIAQQFGVSVNGKKHMTPARKIAPRLGAMRKVGLLDNRAIKVEDEGQLFITRVWFITDQGRAYLDAKLSRSVEGSIGRLNPGQRLLITQGLLNRGYEDADVIHARMIKRQVQYSLGQRRIPWR